MVSTNGKYVTFDEFKYIMTRPAIDQDAVDSDNLSVQTMDDEIDKIDIMKDTMFSDVTVAPLDSKFKEKDEDYKGNLAPIIEGMKKEASAPPKPTIVSLNSIKGYVPVIEGMKKETSAPSKSSLVELVNLKRQNQREF